MIVVVVCCDVCFVVADCGNPIIKRNTVQAIERIEAIRRHNVVRFDHASLVAQRIILIARSFVFSIGKCRQTIKHIVSHGASVIVAIGDRDTVAVFVVG